MNDETLLARWLAGELNEQEVELLKGSPKYATLLGIKEQFEKMERPGEDMHIMLDEILNKPKKTKVVPLYKKRWLHIAASIVILMGLSICLFLFQPSKITAENGESITFALPDNSNVVLNSGSAAQFSKWNWSNNREINLTGEAYFKVAKGKTFEVHTSLGTVTVLGTQFNIKARGKRLEVVCYEGKVKVEHNNKEFILTPHQQIVIEGNTIGNIVEITDDKPNWVNGEIVFVRESLSSIVNEIERRYDINIKVEYESDRTFTGSVSGTDLKAALDTLALYYPVKAEKNGNNIILKPINAKR